MATYSLVHSVRVCNEFVAETFSRLTSIGHKFMLHAGKKPQYATFQVFQCSCGNIGVFRERDVRTGHTASCGCYATAARIKHGQTKSPEYIAWQGMIARCSNPKLKCYPNYGGRGITVCDRWREPNGQGFINFLTDMGPKPHPKLTLERKKVNSGYCPRNCVWATRRTQTRNQRSNVNLTLNGKTQCMADWNEELGFPRNLIRSRLKLGWSVEKTLTTPVRHMKKSSVK